MLLGAHVSIAGGLHKAIERGEILGCSTIQVFTQSSRTWKPAILSEEAVRLFKEAFKNSKTVKRIFAHNSYLLNISASDSKIREQSVRHFITILEQCESYGIESLVTHPGSHRGEGLETGIQSTVKSLDEVLKCCRGFKTKILLENTAGQGDCIGSRFEELRAIVEKVSRPDDIGFCFDTQHAFAAGYELRTQEAYNTTFEEWEKTLGTKNILAFHLNDAVKDIGSRVDRHANIGKGFLGKKPFSFLLADKRFSTIPKCIETDPGENDAFHKADLRVLRSLI